MGEPAVTTGVEVPSYVVGERLGAGGFGEVFRARHAVIDREVAIKVLHSKDPDTVARFVAEGKAVNKISHPGIVEIFDFGTLADGRAYCVMELVHGKTLRDLLRERGKVSLDEALPILRAIAEAIDAAHAAGIVHRDLKPDNVFVTDSGVKLIDFGLAKVLREDTPPITETGAVFGTPLYMSPEQCRGKRITTATDAYSFGCVAYHVLVGEPPFSGEAIELALHHLNDPPPSTKLGERVDRVVLALMAKDPAQRPPKLADAIAAIAGETKLPAKPRVPRRWLVPAVGAVVIAAGGFALARRTGSTPVRDVTCPPAATRLAGVWDASIRDQMRARIGAQPREDVGEIWRASERELDGYAQRWASDWDEVCRDDGKPRDPLLHAQRMACLDLALVALRGATEPFLTQEPLKVATGFPGRATRPGRLEACESEAVLRAQVPAPPPEQREQVMALAAELQHLNNIWRGIVNTGQPGSIDSVLARYHELEQKLDALHSPIAAEVAMYAAICAWAVTKIDPSRSSAAQTELTHAIARAEAYRDDTILARDEVIALEEVVDFGQPAQNGTEAIARAEAAVARAGTPVWVTSELATQHARFDASTGQPDAAIARLEDIRRRVPPDQRAAGMDHNSPDGVLITLLGQVGRTDDAAALARALLARNEQQIGPVYHETLLGHDTLASTLELGGDDAAALAEVDKELEIAKVLDEKFWRGFSLAHKLELELRLDRVDAARATLAALEAEGHLDDTAEIAVALAQWRVLGQLLEHATLSARDRVAAELAFERDPAHAPTPARPAALAYVAGMQGDWKSALDRVKALPHDRATDWELAEASAVEGIALVALGDPKGALAPLQRALWIEPGAGGHYYVPSVDLALARALWDTGGDKQRARWHARHAIAGFSRFGAQRDAEKHAAEAWLKEHE